MLSKSELLEHWEGHRRLTRRMVESFPEDVFVNYTPIAGMRPFCTMLAEILDLEQTLIPWLLTGKFKWDQPEWHSGFLSKSAALTVCDEVREATRKQWHAVGESDLLRREPEPFFQQLPPQTNLNYVLYLIDNEIHHRGQGYVYLRLLGLEPPLFYER